MFSSLLGFQPSATPTAEGAVDLHNYIFYSPVLVFVYLVVFYGSIVAFFVFLLRNSKFLRPRPAFISGFGAFRRGSGEFFFSFPLSSSAPRSRFFPAFSRSISGSRPLLSKDRLTLALAQAVTRVTDAPSLEHVARTSSSEILEGLRKHGELGFFAAKGLFFTSKSRIEEEDSHEENFFPSKGSLVEKAGVVAKANSSCKKGLFLSDSKYQSLRNSLALGDSIFSHYLWVESSVTKKGQLCFYAYPFTSKGLGHLLPLFDGRSNESLATCVQALEKLQRSDPLVAEAVSILEVRGRTSVDIIWGFLLLARSGVTRRGEPFISWPWEIFSEGTLLNSALSGNKTQCVASVRTRVLLDSPTALRLAWPAIQLAHQKGPEFLWNKPVLGKACAFRHDLMRSEGLVTELCEADHGPYDGFGGGAVASSLSLVDEWDRNIRMALFFRDLLKFPNASDGLPLAADQQICFQTHFDWHVGSSSRFVKKLKFKGEKGGSDGPYHCRSSDATRQFYIAPVEPVPFSFSWSYLESWLPTRVEILGLFSAFFDILGLGLTFSFTALVVGMVAGADAARIWAEYYASFFPPGRQATGSHFFACWSAGANAVLACLGLDFRFPSWTGAEQPTLTLVFDNVLGVMLGDPLRWAVLLCFSILVYIPLKKYLWTALERRYPIGARIALFTLLFFALGPVLVFKLSAASLLTLTAKEAGLVCLGLGLIVLRIYVWYRRRKAGGNQAVGINK